MRIETQNSDSYKKVSTKNLNSTSKKLSIAQSSGSESTISPIKKLLQNVLNSNNTQKK